MHKPLPVTGYTGQTEEKVREVNKNKIMEEALLRLIDRMSATNKPEGVPVYDHRWLAIARTHFQEGFMALNRSIFQPQRLTDEEFEAGENVRET